MSQVLNEFQPQIAQDQKSIGFLLRSILRPRGQRETKLTYIELNGLIQAADLKSRVVMDVHLEPLRPDKWLGAESGLTPILDMCGLCAMPHRRNGSPQTQVLLAALMEHPRGWMHGYGLPKPTGLKSCTLYPLLMRLSDQGLLEDRRRGPLRPGSPPRHGCRLWRGDSSAQDPGWRGSPPG